MLRCVSSNAFQRFNHPPKWEPEVRSISDISVWLVRCRVAPRDQPSGRGLFSKKTDQARRFTKNFRCTQKTIKFHDVSCMFSYCSMLSQRDALETFYGAPSVRLHGGKPQATHIEEPVDFTSAFPNRSDAW